MQRHHEHPHQDRDVSDPLSHPKPDAKLKPAIVNMTVNTTTIDNASAGRRKDRHRSSLPMCKDSRIAPIGKTSERYVADDVMDGAGRRSFSADIHREDPSQQFGDAVANRDDLGMGQQLGWNPPTPCTWPDAAGQPPGSPPLINPSDYPRQPPVPEA